MICYWCYWGWPKPIQEIYDRASADLGGFSDPLEFGPGHIVWSDENFLLAQQCLDDFDDHQPRYGESDLQVVRRSLVELASLSDEFKEPPENYDGQNPANFPPPSHWGCPT